MSFAGEIWTTLSAIDCNEHVKKKGNLSYLSWTWAWAALMDRYPESRFEFEQQTDHPDGSVTVRCSVTISDDKQERTRYMWLPVMDNRNNAVKNPDARQISDTKMRCMVKCLALFGLGHYIYAGEDLPSAAKEAQEEERAQHIADWKAVIETATDEATLTDIMRAQVPGDLKSSLREAATNRLHEIRANNENDQSNNQAFDETDQGGA